MRLRRRVSYWNGCSPFLVFEVRPFDTLKTILCTLYQGNPLDGWMDGWLAILRPFQQYFSYIKTMGG